MQEHHLKVERTARVYTLGEFNASTKQIWIVLHGYGQLASFFIKKFEGIAADDAFIIAPEAISRFYVKPYSRVGASWMTFDERKSEIEEYLAYLNSVYDRFLGDHDLSNVTVNLLGFSQGCVTACRWFETGVLKCDRLVLCAGYFNKGLADVMTVSKLDDVETYYIYGTKDEFLIENPVEATAFRVLIQTEVPHLKIISFEGNHTVSVPIIEGIARGLKP